jgi:hypothetical protein
LLCQWMVMHAGNVAVTRLERMICPYPGRVHSFSFAFGDLLFK